MFDAKLVHRRYLMSAQWMMTSMSDDINGRGPQLNTTSIEDDLNGRQPQWKTTSMEDNLNVLFFNFFLLLLLNFLRIYGTENTQYRDANMFYWIKI